MRKINLLPLLVVGLALTVWVTLLTNPPTIEAQGVQPQEVSEVEINLSDKLILRDGSPVQEVFNSTDDMLNLLVKVLFLGSGAVLLFMIVGAGLAMIQGGSGDKEKSKKTMTSAGTGLIIMLAAYWIMQILQLITGIYMGF